MDDILSKVSGETDLIKKIMGKLPGFRGYVEREDRRNADKLLREGIADRFEALWQRISSLQKEAISNGELDKIDDLENSAIKIRQFIDRIRTASYGYTGFFDVIKVNTEELNAIYVYDLQMLKFEEEVSRAVDNVETSFGTDGLAASIRHLATLSQGCIDTFNQRKEVILQMSAEVSGDVNMIEENNSEESEEI